MEHVSVYDVRDAVSHLMKAHKRDGCTGLESVNAGDACLMHVIQLLNAIISHGDLTVFLTLINSFLPARRYASAGLCDSDVSVRLSVCHTPVLCLAERKQDCEMYTI